MQRLGKNKNLQKPWAKLCVFGVVVIHDTKQMGPTIFGVVKIMLS